MKASPEEVDYLGKEKPFLGKWFLNWLKKFTLNPTQVTITDKSIRVKGPWSEATWWEVPILSTISQIFFNHKDRDNYLDKRIIQESTAKKFKILDDGNCEFMEFGTRRRRSHFAQDAVIGEFKRQSSTSKIPTFLGTSNIHFAYKHKLKILGTMPHEWIMGVSALTSLHRANHYALHAWKDVFKGNAGTALTDTFGTEGFLRDFDSELARTYDSTRQDSGCPYIFGNKIIEHSINMGILPMTKKCIFSDGLNSTEAVKIKKYFEGKINAGAGIGTHFTNDFDCEEWKGHPAMNIVMKLVKCNGIPVAKLSDTPSKASGDPSAIKAAKWFYLGECLKSN